MEQQFIAVTETAPRLLELTAGKARVFLREYRSYANRVEDPTRAVPMRRLLEADAVEALLEATEGLVPWGSPAGERGGLNRHLAAEEAEETGSESEDSDDPKEPRAPMGRLSDAHIIAMIVHVLGPNEVVEAGDIFD